MKKTLLCTLTGLVLLIMGTVRAEIPFTHAFGVYEGTKDEYKEISPFWGIVAAQGMLKHIRFFGHYDKDRDGRDQGRDPIASLIQQLFPSPDGVQFVANTRNKDPVGNLSRNLGAINSILETLLSNIESEVKVATIATILHPLNGKLKSKPKLEAEINDTAFANLLVAAYEAENDLANPEIIDQQLYPKNIVIISLLGFFTKVADSKQALQQLPLLMKSVEEVDYQSIFTQEDYNNNLGEIDGIILNAQAQPELPFLMNKWYQAYVNTFTEPVNYRGDTVFNNRPFPDCGETSLRNVFMVLLGTNGAAIAPETLATLQQKIIPVEGIDLNDINGHFQRLMTFLQQNTNPTEASTLDTHNAWAQIVANLNDQSQGFSCNSVQYGRGGNQRETHTHEIKAHYSQIGANGIINMLNVIAKLIPDQVLNREWDDDEEQRLVQAAQKITRFCEILSRPGYTISWENLETHTQTITTPFPRLTLIINGHKAYIWDFIQSGHFQLQNISTVDSNENDWRSKYVHTQFANEWLSYFYVKIDQDKMIEDDTYGTHLPLTYIYNSELQNLDGCLKTLAFALYQTTVHNRLYQFFPLIIRWIDTSIPLNDGHSVTKLGYLLYGPSFDPRIGREIAQILQTFGLEDFMNKSLGWPKRHYNDIIQQMITSNALPTPVLLLTKQVGNEGEIDLDISARPFLTNAFINKINSFTKLISLRLGSNERITDDGLQHLTNLTSLNLTLNDNITDDGLQHLTNLTSLNLSLNDRITDDGLQNLIHLTSLNLGSNDIITDDGLENLTNLTSLDLGSNDIITDDGLENLTNLTSLDLTLNDEITDAGLENLTKLIYLGLKMNTTITNAGLKNLTNLTSLDLSGNTKITDAGLQNLPNLTSLDLSANMKITGAGLQNLTKLTFLRLMQNNKITDAELQNLTKLIYLNLRNNNKITNKGIAPLTALASLDLRNNRKITNDILKELPNLETVIGRVDWR